MVLVEHCFSFWSCFRAYTLSLLCLCTFLFFVYIFYKIIRSHYPIPKPDLAVLILSTVQTFLGFVYYGVWEYVEIVLLIRALKLTQANFICWLFVLGLSRTQRLRCYVNVLFVGLTTYVILAYFVILAIFKPEQSACRDASWLLLSVSGFAMAMVVVGLGLVALYKFTHNSRGGMTLAPIPHTPSAARGDHTPTVTGDVLQHNHQTRTPNSDSSFVQDVDAVPHYDVRYGHAAPRLDSFEAHEPQEIGRVNKEAMEGEGPLSPQAWSREDQSFFGTKRKQLLVLIIIEAISAFLLISSLTDVTSPPSLLINELTKF
eukprot:Selendium_serpulae@DN6093_c1_g1_i2.p1